jgi:hypothetical protein
MAQISGRKAANADKKWPKNAANAEGELVSSRRSARTAVIDSVNCAKVQKGRRVSEYPN